MPSDIDFRDYAEFATKPTNEAMANLEAKFEERQKVSSYLEKFEDLVQRGKKRLAEIDEKELPELMDACGLDECKSKTSGLKFKIHEQMFASIPAQSTIEKCKDDEERDQMQRRRDQAMTWIEENAPDVVDRKFDIQFKKGDEKLAAKFERDLAQRKNPIPVIRSASVNYQTLNSLVRDRVKEGLPVPRDLLGVFTKRVAKVFK